MSNYNHLLVVSCLIRNREGAALAVKHKIRGWELPQGRVETGEALLDALHREVLEETGVTIANPALAMVWSKLSEPSALIHAFVADYASGELLPSDETPEVSWFSDGQLIKHIEHPVNRDRFLELATFQGTLRFLSYTTGPYQKFDGDWGHSK